MIDYFAVNRANWDRRVALHQQTEIYDLEKFRRTRNALDPHTLRYLGDVRGKRILHLQCHFGMDSLSLVSLGAEVTGVDFSPKAIERARELSAELGLPARFLECDVYGLPAVLEETFDLVFTTYGVLTWLPDMDRWAAVAARYVAPGGRLFLIEMHPSLYLFDFDTKRPAFDYYTPARPYYEQETGSYAQSDTTEVFEEYFWQHGLAQILTPLLREGLQLQRFEEFDSLPYNCFPNLRERAPGEYVFEPVPDIRLPHLFLYDLTCPTPTPLSD